MVSHIAMYLLIYELHIHRKSGRDVRRGVNSKVCEHPREIRLCVSVCVCVCVCVYMHTGGSKWLGSPLVGRGLPCPELCFVHGFLSD